MFPERIETDRLRLVRLCREDVDAFELYDCFGRGQVAEEVFEYVPNDPFRTVKEAQDRIDEAEEGWAENERAEYVIRPKAGEDGAGERAGIPGDEGAGKSARDRTDASEIAGTTSLFCEWERRTGRFGLILRKPFWGRGYSGERAAALMDLAFDRLDLELVTAGYNEGNEKSKRAIEKYVEAHGGQYDGVLRNWVPMDDGVDDLHRYTVSREQYREAVGGDRE